MREALLILNVGSSSLKFSVFSIKKQQLSQPAIFSGKIEAIDTAPYFIVKDGKGQIIVEQQAKYLPSTTTPQHAALSFFLTWLQDYTQGLSIKAVCHRVVHGGNEFFKPTKLDPSILAQLQTYNSLAPLHQPYNIAGIEALMDLLPNAQHIACFDTAFHVTQPAIAQAFALPEQITQALIKRFGFHGLSYEYIAGILPKHLGKKATGKVIVAHLGHGASLCAIQNQQSIATTMGFTALDGVPMGTRCGSLDPGVILYLLQYANMTVDEVATLLYKKSGLLGVSGISSDVRELLASNSAAAQKALDLFVYRIVREIGSLTAALQGLDCLVFTAGIGENSPIIRARICEQLSWLRITLDEPANQQNSLRISAATSKVKVLVVPTNEELIMAKHTLELWNKVS